MSVNQLRFWGLLDICVANGVLQKVKFGNYLVPSGLVTGPKIVKKSYKITNYKKSM